MEGNTAIQDMIKRILMFSTKSTERNLLRLTKKITEIYEKISKAKVR